jgi:hypothetical protein
MRLVPPEVVPGNRKRGIAVAERTSVVPRVLAIAQPSIETNDLLYDLERRSDLCLLRVSSTSAARVALQEVAVDLVLVGPTTDTDTLSMLLHDAQELRPETPILAIGSEETLLPPGRASRMLALLRRPVLPEVLNRTVDVALGLRAGDKG